MLAYLKCTGGRNRTHAKGFGDPCTTTIRRPQILNYYPYNGTRLIIYIKLIFGNSLAFLQKNHHYC